MDIMGIDITQIADLTTLVATAGALAVGELVTDEMFEYTVGLVVLIYAQNPD